MTDDLTRLEEVVRDTATALLCYERERAECHRSIIADLRAIPLLRGPDIDRPPAKPALVDIIRDSLKIRSSVPR